MDASIDENLQLMCDGFRELPGFTTVKQGGFYIGIEDPDFGEIKLTWCKFILCIFINLYMFPATVCPSSGETTVFMRHLVLVILCG